MSASPGRATSFTDHNCLSGSWLPLQLPTLPQPGSSICLSPSPWRPIRAGLSPTQPDSMPPKLRGHDTAICCQLDMQLGHTGQHSSVNTGPHFHGVWSPGTHQLSQTRAALISQAARPLQQVKVDSTCRTHQGPTAKGPPLVTTKGFLWTPHMPSCPEPQATLDG